jgi:hypothetical protein
MIIAGAGLAGLIAGNIFRNYSPRIIEMQSSLPSNHKAILRFRDHSVSKATGIEFKKVKVRKAIAFRGEWLSRSNPKVANLYSIKVTGKVQSRSCWNLNDAERFLSPDDFIMRIAKGLKINYSETLHKSLFDGQPIISTIPMPAMMDIVGWKDKPEFPYRSIWSCWCNIKDYDVQVNQTIYYPDLKDPYYRASLLGNKLILEYNQEPWQSREDVISVLSNDFGIDTEVTDLHVKKQKYGKISAIDDNLRKEFLYYLTREFNIYSLGRFATWKQIILDDVVDDAGKIMKLINVETKRRNYQVNLNIMNGDKDES